MRKSFVWLAWIGVALLAVVAAATYFHGGDRRAAGPSGLAGLRAPSIAVPALDGSISSPSTYRGRVVVMNLWATWCPPCRAEMPDLQRLYVTYRVRGLTVVGVDQGESAQRVAGFARSLRIRYPILLDQGQQYGSAYGVVGLPTTILIDRAGIVQNGIDGPLSYSQMVAAVLPLLRRGP